MRSAIATPGLVGDQATSARDPGTARPAAVQPSLGSRIIREPLLQFLLAGAMLFAAYAFLTPSTDRGDRSHRIELTPDDLRQMTVAWLAQGRPAPTQEQMRNLVEARVREEILFREALALGLDTDDTIVKRRMVQKMEFLAEDLSDLREPTGTELESWFHQRAAGFAYPGRVTFRHLYFSPDRRGGEAQADAGRALARLAGAPEDAPEGAARADHFMFQDHYPERAPDQIAKEFGPKFARALFELEPGAWRGPIESGFGWHLVWVESLTPGRVPLFEEVEPEVKQAWVDAQREADRRRLFDAMKARYVVVVPDDLSPPPVGAAPVSDTAAD